MRIQVFRSFRTSMRLLAKKDYYSILGVPRSATESEIKKAYFNLAKQYHPDVNKSPDAKTKFAEINNAYETIGDPQKRQTYDSTGMTGDEQDQAKQAGFGDFGGFGGFNPFGGGFGGGSPFGGGGEGFSSFEDIFGEFEGIFGGKKTKKNLRGEDISVSMEISFLEAVQGAAKQFTISKNNTCGTCKGKKIKPGSSPTTCTTCGGRGHVHYQRGPMSIQVGCQKCGGSGTIIKDYCPTCRGSGIGATKVTETVNIPPGVNTGHTLRMAHKGHASENSGTPGDILIKVTVKEHPTFQRDGYDIISQVPITISQAALGATVEVETLQGKVQVKVSPGTNTGDTHRISNFGITHLPPHSSQKGSHIVKFVLSIPKKLSESQRKLFEMLAKEGA
ncbi:unnamed protein product [Blepharisma stoltei]|uniref:Chaperone protein DnaJ n=1 Tax=Blepharisma stoltei TaxID=1481888 RepID=A0AAU9JNG7_9CILI|nr:unnamed protein product [Blepharisma stoltei]